jgi:hypothetical protein
VSGGVPPDAVVSRLYTAVVSDILDDLGHRDHVLDPAIRPLGRGEVIASPASPFLVTEVDQIPAEPYAARSPRSMTCSPERSSSWLRATRPALHAGANCFPQRHVPAVPTAP